MKIKQKNMRPNLLFYLINFVGGQCTTLIIVGSESEGSFRNIGGKGDLRINAERDSVPLLLLKLRLLYIYINIKIIYFKAPQM